MPKKSAGARSGAQRNKPKVQKSIELVRRTAEPIVREGEQEADQTDSYLLLALEEQKADLQTEVEATSAPTAVALEAASERPNNESAKLANGTATRTRKKAAVEPTAANASVQSEDASSVSSTATAPKGTAAARLAARRQSVQRTQQRAAATLITAEHYAYVRRDLVIIAILAFIMFATLIALHFVPAIGG